MESADHDGITHDIEHELTVRLERASDLSERAKRANNAAQHEIDRALQIADELLSRVRVACSAVASLAARPVK